MHSTQYTAVYHAPCAACTILTHSKFSHTAKAPLAVPVTATVTTPVAPEPADGSPAKDFPPFPMATPHVKVSVIAFSADEKTHEESAAPAAAEVETVSFDVGARSSISEDCFAAGGGVLAAVSEASAEALVLPLPLPLVLAFPRREERFGRRLQKRT